MTVNNYFILKTSDEEVEKKFFVVFSGYRPLLTRNENVSYTLDGSLDLARGANREIHTYLIRVHDTEPEGSEYGTLADLKFFWSLNDPGGVPSDVITLVDHFGTSHQVMIVKEFSPEILSPVIESENSLAFVNIVFHFL